MMKDFEKAQAKLASKQISLAKIDLSLYENRN
jgi:hypothetical protein